MRGRVAPFRHRAWRSTIIGLTVLVVIGLIGASPLALSGFRGTTARWERLSFIGQTYGAASAILAVLALIGVVVTLVLQAHETRLAREEARRAAIGDLLRMAMDDPDLDECWGPIPAGQDLRTRRQQMYVNMILSEWQMSFETGPWVSGGCAPSPARCSRAASAGSSGCPRGRFVCPPQKPAEPVASIRSSTRNTGERPSHRSSFPDPATTGGPWPRARPPRWRSRPPLDWWPGG